MANEPLNEQTTLLVQEKYQLNFNKLSVVQCAGSFVSGATIGMVGSLLVNHGLINLGEHCLLGTFGVSVFAALSTASCLYFFKKCSSQDSIDLADAIFSFGIGGVAGLLGTVPNVVFSTELCSSSITFGTLAKDTAAPAAAALFSSLMSFWGKRNERVKDPMLYGDMPLILKK